MLNYHVFKAFSVFPRYKKLGAFLKNFYPIQASESEMFLPNYINDYENKTKKYFTGLYMYF